MSDICGYRKLDPGWRACVWRITDFPGISNSPHRLEPGSSAEAGAGRDRQSDRELTLGWVGEYQSGACKVKKEIPDKSGRGISA